VIVRRDPENLHVASSQFPQVRHCFSASVLAQYWLVNES
jgi:hypothetical protein